MSKQYTWEEVKKHNTASSLWTVYKGKVYDLTEFQEDHPGGDDVLKDQAGADSTQAFDDIGHSPEAIEQMKEFLIGDLKEDPEAKAKAERAKRAAASSSSSSSDAQASSLVKRIAIPVILVLLAFGINSYFS